MSFIRPAIRTKRPETRPMFQPLPTEGDGILAIVNRAINSPMPPYVKPDRRPVYIHLPTEHHRHTKESYTLAPVKVYLIVSGDRVKLKLDTLSWHVHTEYFAKGKKPPLGIYLRSLAQRGVSDEQLEKVVKSYKKWEDPEYLRQIDDMIERIWPGKSTSTKEKTPQTRKVLKAVKKI
jgi:hypothetical protein